MSIRTHFLALMFAAVLSLAGCQTTEEAKKPAPTTGPPVQRNSPAETSAKPGLPGVARPDVPSAAPVVAPSPRVDKLELESFPSAVNLDDQPGPDGVSLKVRLYSLDQPLAFALEQGDIEFVLYEGSVKETEISAAEPFHTWRFSAPQIAQSGRKTIVGWQYAMSLNWAGHVPSTPTVTLVARVLRPSGSPLYARPVHLAVGPR